MRITRTVPALCSPSLATPRRSPPPAPPSGNGGLDAAAKADAASPHDANFSFMPADGSAGEAPGPDLDCATAAKEKGNAGCHFYAVPLPVKDEGSGQRCFAMYVVNPGNHPVKLALERGGAPISLVVGKLGGRGRPEHHGV